MLPIMATVSCQVVFLLPLLPLQSYPLIFRCLHSGNSGGNSGKTKALRLYSWRAAYCSATGPTGGRVVPALGLPLSVLDRMNSRLCWCRQQSMLPSGIVATKYTLMQLCKLLIISMLCRGGNSGKRILILLVTPPAVTPFFIKKNQELVDSVYFAYLCTEVALCMN